MTRIHSDNGWCCMQVGRTAGVAGLITRQLGWTSKKGGRQQLSARGRVGEQKGALILDAGRCMRTRPRPRHLTPIAEHLIFVVGVASDYSQSVSKLPSVPPHRPPQLVFSTQMAGVLLSSCACLKGKGVKGAGRGRAGRGGIGSGGNGEDLVSVSVLCATMCSAWRHWCMPAAAQA